MIDVASVKMEQIRQKTTVIQEANRKINDLHSMMKILRKTIVRLTKERDELINTTEVQAELRFEPEVEGE